MSNAVDELAQLKARNAQLEAEIFAATEALRQAHVELDKQQEEVDALHQFDRELTRSEDLSFILEYVVTWAIVRTNSEYGLVARWDEHRRIFEVLQAHGEPADAAFQAGDTLELPPELMPDEHSQKRSTGVMFDVVNTRMISELRHADGRLIGVMLLQRHNQVEYTEADKKFTRSIADRLATSMHMAMLLRRVQDLNHRRKQLFRMLSHDLRQPLTVLMGYIQLIEHAIKANQLELVATYMPHVANGAKDLKELLEEVLLMERVSDMTRADWETVSLRNACENAIVKHRPQADLANHALDINLPEDEAMVKGLKIELQEAAGNLISNAIKYTPAGGTIRVALTSENGRWYFVVSDNGYGIDEERQRRLFESFYRAQQPGTENIKGTGLGLNLVKTIIEKHDGETFFESEVGVGSTFGFWLPAEDGQLE